MEYSGDTILTINGGSSSIKFALFEKGDLRTKLISGALEKTVEGATSFQFYNLITQEKDSIVIDVKDQEETIVFLIDWLKKQLIFGSIKAIGHRIVQGMQQAGVEKITAGLLERLKEISAYDPEHLPEEIGIINLFERRCPSLLQFVCYDSHFHRTMPTVASMLAIPRRYHDRGIYRYGFHGLSYTYLVEELEKLAGRKAAQGKLILAHLGSGASLAAVKGGQSLDTTMGFTPASGMPMGTRSGDLDPGIAWYLMQFERMDAKQFSELVNHESGLLGVSGLSADMRKLLEAEETDVHAAEAIELFCYHAKKYIGAYAAALGGLETLVFAGGIGEHSPGIRSKICDGLGFLGIELCEIANMKNEGVISAKKSNVTVRVIRTDEELMIARLVNGILGDAPR